MKSLYQNGNHSTSFNFIDKPKLNRYKITKIFFLKIIFYIKVNSILGLI